MTDKEYMECRFIESEMRFDTFELFLQDAEAIKKLYKALKHKIFYKWYVYSQKISNTRKNAIWCYLNDDISYEKLTTL